MEKWIYEQVFPQQVPNCIPFGHWPTGCSSLHVLQGFQSLSEYQEATLGILVLCIPVLVSFLWQQPHSLLWPRSHGSIVWQHPHNMYRFTNKSGSVTVLSVRTVNAHRLVKYRRRHSNNSLITSYCILIFYVVSYWYYSKTHQRRMYPTVLWSHSQPQ